MTIETIDNVQYYVWRAGDELPKYQPKQVSAKSVREPFFQRLYVHTGLWDTMFLEARWPKLINDRAQHQRMIDEALVEFADRRPVQTFDVSVNMDEGVRLIESGEDKQKGLRYLSGAVAHILRLMEWAQEQIDKEENK